MSRAHLRVVDTNGEIHDLEEFSDPVEENKALRAALTRQENVIKALRADKAAERRNYVQRALIEDAFEDWRRKMVAAGMRGKARCKLSDDRFDAMKGMAEAGYSLADFELVNEGLAACRFVSYGKRSDRGQPSDVQVDIAYVCEKARRFEEAAQIGYRVVKAREACA